MLVAETFLRCAGLIRRRINRELQGIEPLDLLTCCFVFFFSLWFAKRLFTYNSKFTPDWEDSRFGSAMIQMNSLAQLSISIPIRVFSYVSLRIPRPISNRETGSRIIFMNIEARKLRREPVLERTRKLRPETREAK